MRPARAGSDAAVVEVARIPGKFLLQIDVAGEPGFGRERLRHLPYAGRVRLPVAGARVSRYRLVTGG
jgi:hypothetical protein